MVFSNNGDARRPQIKTIRGIPKGHSLPFSREFMREQRLIAQIRAKRMNALGVRGRKAAEVKTLYRIRKAVAILGEDTHTAAATRETAILLLRFMKSELEEAKTERGAVANSLFGETPGFLEALRELTCDVQRSVNSDSVADARFTAKDKPPSVKSLEGVIRDAEFALRGRASTNSEIIFIDQRFLTALHDIVGLKLKRVLGNKNYADLKNLVISERRKMREQSLNN